MYLKAHLLAPWSAVNPCKSLEKEDFDLRPVCLPCFMKLVQKKFNTQALRSSLICFWWYLTWTCSAVQNQDSTTLPQPSSSSSFHDRHHHCVQLPLPPPSSFHPRHHHRVQLSLPPSSSSLYRHHHRVQLSPPPSSPFHNRHYHRVQLSLPLSFHDLHHHRVQPTMRMIKDGKQRGKAMTKEFT